MIFWFWSFSKSVYSTTGIDASGLSTVQGLGGKYYPNINDLVESVVSVKGEMMEMQECYIYVGF